MLDARYKKFFNYSTPQTRIVICYIIKDHHLHLILDKELKQAACEANKGGAKNIFKNLLELKWRNRSESIIKLNDINEITDLECNDAYVVLPKEIKIEEAIGIVVNKFDLYIEYLHWSNSGKLDSFINHHSNMFISVVLNLVGSTEPLTFHPCIHRTLRNWKTEWIHTLCVCLDL